MTWGSSQSPQSKSTCQNRFHALGHLISPLKVRNYSIIINALESLPNLVLPKSFQCFLGLKKDRREACWRHKSRFRTSRSLRSLFERKPLPLFKFRIQLQDVSEKTEKCASTAFGVFLWPQRVEVIFVIMTSFQGFPQIRQVTFLLLFLSWHFFDLSNLQNFSSKVLV